MKYVVSNYGYGVSVGLLDKETAEQDMNLAHNLFNVNSNEYLFHGSINFRSLKEFKRLLAFKEYYKQWETHWQSGNKEYNNCSFWKKAFAAAKKELNTSVSYNNFMDQISSANNHYNVGYYQDELIEE
jgi:hypothetical protein